MLFSTQKGSSSIFTQPQKQVINFELDKECGVTHIKSAKIIFFSRATRYEDVAQLKRNGYTACNRSTGARSRLTSLFARVTGSCTKTTESGCFSFLRYRRRPCPVPILCPAATMMMINHFTRKNRERLAASRLLVKDGARLASISLSFSRLFPQITISHVNFFGTSSRSVKKKNKDGSSEFERDSVSGNATRRAYVFILAIRSAN